MKKENIIKILIGIVAVCVIIITVLNQTGITSQIKEIKKEKKMAEEKRNWTSKEYGDMKMTVTIYDNTQETQLGGNLIGVSKKSHKYPNYSDEISDFYKPIEQIKEQSEDYNKIQVCELYEPKGKYSKLYYYFCFVLFDCDYVLIERKKYKTQTGEIKTQNAGKIKFRIAIFLSKEIITSNDDEQKVVFYDTSAKMHRIAEE